jgi:type IV pilus assembly protein PilV
VKNRSAIRLRAQAGFTLIEALTSVLIMSVGLLGVAALQSRSLSTSFSAGSRSQAVVLVGDIAARMRASPVDYAAVQVADEACREVHFAHRHPAHDCTAQQLAADDVADWRASVAATLPAGMGAIRRQGDHYLVEISWDERTSEPGVASRQRVITALRP